MDAPTLATWLLAASARLLDASGHPGHPSQAVVDAIASESILDPVAGDVEHTAALLLVMAFHESSYRVNVKGDHGKSCGLLQTPCAITPPTAVGQVHLALRLLRQSFTACPAHPLALYGTGRCIAWGQGRISEAQALVGTP